MKTTHSSLLLLSFVFSSCPLSYEIPDPTGATLLLQAIPPMLQQFVQNNFFAVPTEVKVVFICSNGTRPILCQLVAAAATETSSRSSFYLYFLFFLFLLEAQGGPVHLLQTVPSSRCSSAEQLPHVCASC